MAVPKETLSETKSRNKRQTDSLTVKEGMLYVHTHTQPFNGPLSGTTRVGNKRQTDSLTVTEGLPDVHSRGAAAVDNDGLA